MIGSSRSSQSSRLTNCNSKPTKHKATLFGSVLDNDATKDVSMTNIDLDAFEESTKPKIQVRDPPPVLQTTIKDLTRLEPARAELEARKKVFWKADADLKQLETHVRFFPGDFTSEPPTARQPASPDPHHPSVTAKDLAYASSMKVLGVDANNNPNYNAQVDEKRSQTHKHNPNADVLNRIPAAPQQKSRFDNALKNKTSRIFAESSNQNTYDTNYHDNYGDEMQLELSDSTSVILPKNIEHLFGSRVCQEVLADKERVSSVLEKQARARAQSRRAESTTPTGNIESARQFTQYDDLGNNLRYDHFPGFSCNQTGSHNKETYTDAVHKNKVEGTNQWRNKRDQLSVWAESNILRERQKKAWDAKKDSQDPREGLKQNP